MLISESNIKVRIPGKEAHAAIGKTIGKTKTQSDDYAESLKKFRKAAGRHVDAEGNVYAAARLSEAEAEAEELYATVTAE